MVLCVLILGLTGRHDLSDTLFADLLAVRQKYPSDPNRFCWQAYHLVNDAVNDRPWPELRASLKKQKFKVDDGVTGWGDFTPRIDAKDLDYILPGGLKMEFEIGLSVKPIVSEKQPTHFTSQFSWMRLKSDSLTPFSQLAMAKPFGSGTPESEMFGRPQLLKLAQRFPYVSNIEVSYKRPNWGRRGEDTSPYNPFQLNIELSLDDNKGRVFGPQLRYEADSHLEARKAVSGNSTLPWPSESPAFGPVLDNMGSEMFALDTTHTKMTSKSDFLWMVELEPDDEGESSPEKTVAYGKADILSLSKETKELTVFADKFSPEVWTMLKNFTNLHKLSVSGASMTSVKESDMALISGISSLEDLDIRDEKIGDAFARSLKRLSHMNKIGIGGKGLTDDGIISIASVQSLRTMYIVWCKSASDTSLNAISSLKNLEHLGLPDEGDFSNNGIEKLSRLKRLKSISLSGVRRVSPKTLYFLGNLKDLEQVVITDGTVDVKLMTLLGKLPKLNFITMSRTKGLTDASLQQLKGLKKLGVLQIMDCPGVTDKGIKDLRKMLPKKYRTSTTL